jgi:hypothetical protein
MITHKKKFYTGLGMLAGFAVILGILFSPVFGGHNGLNFLDALYNSISKGSAYYIPSVREKTEPFSDTIFSAILPLGSELRADQVAVLLEKAGAKAVPSGNGISVTGNLGDLFDRCLMDADLMYQNEGQSVRAVYGMDEKTVLYGWHLALTALKKELNRQKEFKAAKTVDTVIDKAVDLSYNYYGIESGRISDSPGVVIFSLFFYVIYTLWFGFSILFLFEGLGMQLDH